jgi:hypothetical protein
VHVLITPTQWHLLVQEPEHEELSYEFEQFFEHDLLQVFIFVVKNSDLYLNKVMRKQMLENI